MVPAEKQVEDHPGYLFEEGICGVRNDENEGGDQKPVASFSNMYVEVVADISRKQVPGEALCGRNPEVPIVVVQLMKKNAAQEQTRSTNILKLKWWLGLENLQDPLTH